MIFDDDPPPPKPTRLPRVPLDTLGVSELQDYIVELKGEIARVEADIERKGRHRSTADAFFRQPGQGG